MWQKQFVEVSHLGAKSKLRTIAQWSVMTGHCAHSTHGSCSPPICAYPCLVWSSSSVVCLASPQIDTPFPRYVPLEIEYCLGYTEGCDRHAAALDRGIIQNHLMFLVSFPPADSEQFKMLQVKFPRVERWCRRPTTRRLAGERQSDLSS